MTNLCRHVKPKPENRPDRSQNQCTLAVGFMSMAGIASPRFESATNVCRFKQLFEPRGHAWRIPRQPIERKPADQFAVKKSCEIRDALDRMRDLASRKSLQIYEYGFRLVLVSTGNPTECASHGAPDMRAMLVNHPVHHNDVTGCPKHLLQSFGICLLNVHTSVPLRFNKTRQRSTHDTKTTSGNRSTVLYRFAHPIPRFHAKKRDAMRRIAKLESGC